MGKTLKIRDRDHGENCRCKKCRAREEALNRARTRVSSFKGITWEDDYDDDDFLYERRRQNY